MKKKPAMAMKMAKVKKHEASEKKSGHEKIEKLMEKSMKMPMKKKKGK